MSIDDLKNALGDNKITKNHISAAEISNIMGYTSVSLEMDRSSLDYYYSINVQSLLDSDMPVSDLDDLKKQGWAFAEDDKYLILYI
jgi:hypothetical protein